MAQNFIFYADVKTNRKFFRLKRQFLLTRRIHKKHMISFASMVIDMTFKRKRWSCSRPQELFFQFHG